MSLVIYRTHFFWINKIISNFFAHYFSININAPQKSETFEMHINFYITCSFLLLFLRERLYVKD